MTTDDRLNAVDDALRAAGIMGVDDVVLEVLVDEAGHDRDEAIGVVLAAYPGYRYGEAARLVDLAREALA